MFEFLGLNLGKEAFGPCNWTGNQLWKKDDIKKCIGDGRGLLEQSIFVKINEETNIVKNEE